MIGIGVGTSHGAHTAPAAAVSHTKQTAAQTCYDRSGNGNHGTPTGMVDGDFTDDTPGGHSGYSATFASGKRIVVPHAAALNPEANTDFSFSLWVKTTHSGSTAMLWSKMASTTNRGFQINVDSSNRLNFWLASNTGSSDMLNVYTAANLINDGAWHHIVVTWEGTTSLAAANATIYIDGSAVSVTVDNNSLSGTVISTQDMELAARRSALYLPGSLDEPAMLDKVLTSGNVTTLYGGGDPTDIMSSALSGNVIWHIGLGEYETA